MSPIQQMLLGAGAVAKKTYVDDIFSTFLYKGNNGNTLNINNGIDLTGEGGMTWIKCRDTGSTNHSIYDTVRGASELLWANSNAAQMDQTGCGSNKALYQFNNNGFTLGGDCNGTENWDQKAFSSWTFRKAKGFFDVVTFNETGSPHADFTVSHSLGCIPGMIILKRTDGSSDWWVWHKYDPTGLLRLNTTAANTDMTNDWCIPTSTNFTFRPTYVGAMGAASWVAYLFAGGESTAATANSASFAADVCYTDSSSNYTLGTSDFTLEYWYKADSNPSSGNSSYIVDYNDDDWATRIQPDGTHQYMVGDTARITSTTSLGEGQWNHIAIVRSSSTSRMYVNGVQEGGTYSDSTDYSFTQFYMGRRYNGTNQLYGKISNLRLVVGTAVYTSSFRPPTEPLTNITNTKLLGLNSSSVTGTTVGTIQISGNTDLSPTASTDSPFDDPAAFTFGDAGDQGIIKCGSYVGNGSSTGPEINLGWEPQWLLIRGVGGGDWNIVDCMRGIATGGNDNRLWANLTGAESASLDVVDVTATGFKITHDGSSFNATGTDGMIYMAIRRPDGYVGKPPELGTGVFAMDTGNGSSTIPTFDSTFPVDMSLVRNRYDGSTSNWELGSRSLGSKFMYPNLTNSEATSGKYHWDSNAGVHTSASGEYDSNSFAWMWKRHAGFDVVTYTGTGAARTISHSMNAVPQMMWIKDRTTTGGGGSPWYVYHSGTADSGMGYGYLNNTDAWSSSGLGGAWNSTAPTSTAFSLGTWAGVNYSGASFIAMLFASVDGISKLGYYDGSSSDVTVTTGFQPRFVMIKKSNGNGGWFVADTIRGWTASSTNTIKLNANAAQAGNSSFSGPISTGFTVSGGQSNWNASGNKYIYYAHA